MSKEGKAHLNNVAMLSLSRPILLMSVGARDSMAYAYALKIGLQGLILASPVGLDSEYLSVKLPFYEFLEISKALEDLRFKTQKVDPSEFTVVINEANIITMMPNRAWCRPPHIRVNEIQRAGRNTRRQ